MKDYLFAVRPFLFAKPLRLLLLVTIAIVICGIGGCREGEKTMPTAERGVIDLSGWDPVRHGPIALDGQWEFYWDQLLTPDDFAAGNVQTSSGYLVFPGYWKGYELNGHSLPGTGQATFRLRILPAPGVRQLTVRFLSIRAAYRIWANGTLVATSGVVGRSVEAETPDRSIVLSPITIDGAPIDLVMQISNHFFPGGGVQNPIVLAEQGVLEQAHNDARSWGLLFSGCMLIMALYHFILYILRKKDLSTLYFGLYCMVLTVLVASNDASDWLIRSYLQDVQFVVLSKIALVCYAISTSILYRFYRSLFPNEFGRILLYIVDVRGLLFILTVFFLPGLVFQTALQLFALTAVFITACFIILLFVCFRRGYSGSLVLLCGIIVLGVTSTHDIYYLIFSTHVESLLPLGLFALVLSQAMALAQRFSNSFTSVEHLSEALEIRNVNLEEEIAERSRLEREIVNLSEEERRRISIDIHDGLCQQLTGACLRCASLSQEDQNPEGRKEELRQLSAVLDGLVNQAYDLSCGIWPLEHGDASAGPSLEDMIRRYSRSSGIPMKFQDERACEVCRNMQVTQLYRIAQEAISNAVKHANPQRITVSFDCSSNGMATLAVRDDGVGRSAADQSKGGLGMNIMAHRAMMIGGDLQIVDMDEAEGGGTMVVCSVACHSAARPKGEEDDI
ncbi:MULTISPECIES: 7TM diverse intracellular signaling domain-containing protein [unclassified Pseudodesulfovibrio]|uniref:sensor histidine kinase n=1 Tax=unclassified Pseudodesulfovibrio TaxID=2661612 RepID=UPI0013E31233|nr:MULTISPECIES: 7TM diverse intracellular signaling domain-containing protein [unclassified Pseudodesulfovibrio]MCJ2163350.1 ATP-binding protein [Pseudodesulfovibrio sp. S3-i]